MAVGREDYSTGVAPIKSTYAGNQTPYIKDGAKTLAPLETGFVIDYTVPEGYVFHFQMFSITSNRPGINVGAVYHIDVFSFFFRFDSHYIYNFPSNFDITVKAGEIVKVQIVNHDNIDNDFLAFIGGYLEDLT